MTPMLSINDLSAYYGAICALRSVTIQIQPNELVAVLGANGAGKTTLLRAITGLIARVEGEVSFSGKPIQGEEAHRRVQLGIAMVPEGRGIFPNLTVLENLKIGAYLYRQESSRKESEAILERVYNHFPVLKDRRSQRAGTLSGGEQQMLSIGRALMSRPRLLLLDEPSMGLSPIFVSEIFKLIRKVNSDGTTILLVEQNANAALKIAHRGYVLDRGTIAHSGTSSQLMASEEVKSAYLS
jgi:branched-chain amino acid transport system ATP-binding protein